MAETSIPTPTSPRPAATLSDFADSACVCVWTDGSSLLRDKTGGWAFLAVYNDARREYYGSKSDTTNNEMELMAILRALQFVHPQSSIPLRIYTDSLYSKNALTLWHDQWVANGWVTATGDPVRNRELIEETVALIRLHRLRKPVEFIHIRGHSGIPENEYVDRLASSARKQRDTNWTTPTHK